MYQSPSAMELLARARMSEVELPRRAQPVRPARSFRLRFSLPKIVIHHNIPTGHRQSAGPRAT